MANQKGMADVKPGPYSRVKGGGGQNAGSAKTMSGGNKRGGKSGGGSSMGVKPRNNYPGGMGNS